MKKNGGISQDLEREAKNMTKGQLLFQKKVVFGQNLVICIISKSQDSKLVNSGKKG
jgi:hypothetical protein